MTELSFLGQHANSYLFVFMTMSVMVAGDRHPVLMSKNCLRAQEDLDKKKKRSRHICFKDML